MLGHAVSTEARRPRPHTATEAAMSPRVSQRHLIPKAWPSGWAGSLRPGVGRPVPTASSLPLSGVPAKLGLGGLWKLA